MASIFTKIINGEIPCYKIAEDLHYFAFLDIHPLSKGHVLVVPKQETDYIFDLSPEMLGGLMQFAQRVAAAIQKSVPCNRVGAAVIGLEVPHAHIHLVPIMVESDIDFRKPKLTPSSEEMNALAEQIRSHFI